MTRVARARLLVAVTTSTLILAFTASLPAQASEQHANTPIKHVIVVMQQNHTFDNYFGTYPGADGIPPDTCVPVNPNATDRTACVTPYYIGDKPIDDLNHGKATFSEQYNNGRMDGFISALNRRNQNGTIALGYYDDRELPYYWNLADEYVLFDRYFSSARAGSIWNRMFWIAGVPGNVESRIPKEGFKNIPTIFDRLQERGLSWKVYIQNYNPEMNYRSAKELNVLPPQVQWMPLLAMDRFIDDPKLSSRIVDLDQYYVDLREGNLPAVSYVLALGATEHPLTSLELGQRTVRHMMQALMHNDAWYSSAFMITYDDWGGWYDHVPPPEVDQYGYGFRVPAMLVSPYAKRGYIDSTILDNTSVLRFIQYNWDIEPLSERDAAANMFLGALDFLQQPREPRFISYERQAAKPLPDPNRLMIFGTYGMGIALAGIIMALAALFANPARPETAPDEAPSPRPEVSL